MEYQGVRTVKTSKFENARSNVKKCCDHWEKIISQTNHIYQLGQFTCKSCIDFKDKPVAQYVPVVENTFFDDWK